MGIIWKIQNPNHFPDNKYSFYFQNSLDKGQRSPQHIPCMKLTFVSGVELNFVLKKSYDLFYCSSLLFV